MQEILSILISQIEVGPHRRRSEQEDEEIQGIAASIKRIGIIEPIIVVRKGDAFLLVAGHRRIAASKIAGLAEIPAILREASDANAAEVAFAENFFRRDLSPVELAAAIRGCIDDKVMTIEQLAKGLHRSEQWICDQAKLTTWPDEVLQAIHARRLSVSAGRNLAAISEPNYRAFLLRNAVENGVTARVTAGWLQAWQLSRPPEEALSTQPVAGVMPAAAVVPQAPCLFCAQVKRTDALNYMPVCGVCLADFQDAKAKHQASEKQV